MSSKSCPKDRFPALDVVVAEYSMVVTAEKKRPVGLENVLPTQVLGSVAHFLQLPRGVVNLESATTTEDCATNLCSRQRISADVRSYGG